MTSVSRESHLPTSLESTVVFRSKLPDIDVPVHLPLHTYCFQKALSEFADRPYLIDGSTGETHTFSETHFVCRRTAVGLSALGVKKGDVIMLLLQNSPEFAFAFLGASMIGAVVTTANPVFTPQEILKQLKASGAKLVVTHNAHVDKLRVNGFLPVGAGEDGELTVVTVDDDPPEDCLCFSSVLSNADEGRLPEDIVVFHPDDPVALLFSSGTTGLPKGVILTHRNLVTNIAQQVDGENPHHHFSPGDVVLGLLPMFHVFSLNCILLCSLRAGAAVVTMRKFEMGALLGLIERHRVSVVPLVPPVMVALAKSPLVDGYDLESVRIVLSGAAPLGKEIEETLRRRLPHAALGQGYGMTESGPVISTCLGFAKHPFSTKSGSCGTVLRNTELKIVDPETGASLGRNLPGEICVRGQQVMKGYLNDPDATSTTIDVEGWLHTGDIGYVDDDDEIFIVDRLKELIKVKGFQVPPAELEALLISHPSIADAAVVPRKDEVAGEVPVAFVVMSDGFELTENDVKDFIANQVVFYKRLHKVYFVSAIPKSSSGKILRKDLRAKLYTL